MNMNRDTMLELLRQELTKATEAYEAATKICQNPYALADAWWQRAEALGKANGIAKAIEILTAA